MVVEIFSDWAKVDRLPMEPFSQAAWLFSGRQRLFLHMPTFSKVWHSFHREFFFFRAHVEYAPESRCTEMNLLQRNRVFCLTSDRCYKRHDTLCSRSCFICPLLNFTALLKWSCGLEIFDYSQVSQRQVSEHPNGAGTRRFLVETVFWNGR